MQPLYLAASSRKMADPISVLILSQSASGKSLLVDTVRRLMPPEEVVAVSSLSDQALNYLGEGGLLHKFLILGEYRDRQHGWSACVRRCLTPSPPRSALRTAHPFPCA